MPREDYKKWFAKDDNGVYFGTEPSREWTAEELEEEFGAYRPASLNRELMLGASTECLTRRQGRCSGVQVIMNQIGGELYCALLLEGFD